MNAPIMPPQPTMTPPIYNALNRTSNAGHYGDSVLQLAQEIMEGGGDIKDHEFFYCGIKLQLTLAPTLAPTLPVDHSHPSHPSHPSNY